MSTVLVLNGPNLGRLGTREPEIYGSATLDDLRAQLTADAPELTIDLRQTDDEGTMLGWLHAAADERTPVILNAGAWTHYSYALQDAVSMVSKAGITVVEVHISNPHAREEFRHTSVLTPVVTGVIAGFGFESYRLALAFIRRNQF
ncbi:type II 3-dehydroquinate dehydratase [Diaminobutyricibacter sp. McL0608]|uniref:type II 3-dehydroquinate dehydratase n=1 Tax=Leifsonia sp. McL0608 TaxID=3143537 RepID=UPI0031F31A9B